MSHGGAQIVPPVTPATPQEYTSYGTIKSAPQLTNHTQSSLHALDYNYNAHIPMQSQEMEHIRPQNASLPNHLLQSTQAFPHMTHIGTPQAHLAVENVYTLLGSEHLKPSPSLSQNTASQASTSEKYVVPHQPTHTSTTMLPSHTSQLPIHHGQTCIVDKPIGNTTPSSPHSELPREGGAPTFVFSATKSQDGSPSLGLHQGKNKRSFFQT